MEITTSKKLGTAIGTRMAPSYASLFMGKFEKEFLDSCNIQPLLWLRFLDDIFMIWNESEEQLLKFLYEINQYHETIKFTGYQHSLLFPQCFQKVSSLG